MFFAALFLSFNEFNMRTGVCVAQQNTHTGRGPYEQLIVVVFFFSSNIYKAVKSSIFLEGKTVFDYIRALCVWVSGAEYVPLDSCLYNFFFFI